VAKTVREGTTRRRSSRWGGRRTISKPSRSGGGRVLGEVGAHGLGGAAEGLGNVGGLVAQRCADPDDHPEGAGEHERMRHGLRGGLVVEGLAEAGDVGIAVAQQILRPSAYFPNARHGTSVEAALDGMVGDLEGHRASGRASAWAARTSRSGIRAVRVSAMRRATASSCVL